MSGAARKLRRAREKAKPRVEHSEKTRTCFHEAGHAVASVLLGRPFVHVSTEQRTERLRNGDHAILVEGIEYTDERMEANRADIREGKLQMAELLTWFAGWAAEGMICGFDDKTNFHAETDKDYARYAIGNGLLHAPDKVKNDLLAGLVSGALNGVQALLAKHWPAVEGVAELLAERGRLTYAEVESIVRSPTEVQDV